ncbi:MAG: hypothetical protein KAI47_00560 [Deltaproteobacteria bacterium]|nr:hypothetical protein [Deltaproteobacteria bacterium]
MASLDPIQGISFELFSELSAASIGESPETVAALVAGRSIPKNNWDAALQGWSQRLSEAGGDSELARRYKALLTEALRKLCGDSFKLLSFDDYVRSTVLAYSGASYEEVVASVGYDMRQHTLAGYLWTEKLEHDAWQNARFQLLLRRGVAQKTGAGGREVESYIPGTMIRGRRCPTCGSMKINPPLTAYIYCDFCGTLFDYDASVSWSDAGTLDSEDVDATLNQASGKKLRAAFEAGDKAEYARILRWRNEVAIEVAPEGYSPRIGDPEYRQTLIEKVLVPWQVATRFDANYMALSKEVDAASEVAIEKVTKYIGKLNMGSDPESEKMLRRKETCRTKILALLKVSRKLWQLEGAILEREGIFAAHPDSFTRELFMRTNASNFVRPWLGMVPGDVGEELLNAAGVRDEYIKGPAVEMEKRGCGQCGRKLEIPKGAERMVCEGCGQVLDLKNRTFPCPQCGAGLAVSTKATQMLQYHCGFCDAHFNL